MSKLHWLALVTIPGISGVTARKLVEHFGSAEAVFAASAAELCRVSHLTPAVIGQLQAISFERVADELASLNDAGIDVLTWDDDAYPPNLRSVADAPPVLFVCGTVLPTDSGAVAIVGTREPTARAATLAEDLAAALAQRGLTIVSGLALGIDTAAHRGALRARRGRTLAVPGSGLHTIFPPENAALAEQISRRGAVLSELRPNAPASGPSLMARDRIVSGLSRAVIVVECRIHSGTMDTVRRAQEQKRLLLAVPGSEGTQAVLADGGERLDLDHVDLDALAERIRRHPIGDERDRVMGNEQQHVQSNESRAQRAGLPTY